MWIRCDYLIPSTRFHLTANQTLASTISALEGAITKYNKKWLKLSGNATWAITYHPSVVKTPSLASVKARAELSLIVNAFARQSTVIVHCPLHRCRDTRHGVYCLAKRLLLLFSPLPLTFLCIIGTNDIITSAAYG